MGSGSSTAADSGTTISSGDGPGGDLEARYVSLEAFLRKQLQAQARQLAEQAAAIDRLAVAVEQASCCSCAPSVVSPGPAAGLAAEAKADVMTVQPELEPTKLWTQLKQLHFSLVDDVARYTPDEMRKNWSELQRDNCTAREVRGCASHEAHAFIS